MTQPDGTRICARAITGAELAKPKRFRAGEWLAFRNVDLPKYARCHYNRAYASGDGPDPCQSWMSIASREANIYLVEHSCRKARKQSDDAIQCDLPPGHYQAVLGKIKDVGFRWVFLSDITLVP